MYLKFSASGRLQLDDRWSALVRKDLSGLSTFEVAKNASVYSTCEQDGKIYLVERGRVKTVMYDGNGKECLLSIYAAGDIFGELCLARMERTETALAMKTTVLRRISAEKLLQALAGRELLEGFIEHLASRLLEQQQAIANLVMMDSEHRLAAVLLQLASKLGKRRAHCLHLDERITQEDLSGMVGTTRSRVGYFLKKFREKGLVERTPGTFLTVHEPLLAAYVDGGPPETWPSSGAWSASVGDASVSAT